VTLPAPAAGAGPTLGEEFILLGPEGSRPFHAPGLEAELRGMWRSAATDGATGGRPVYRAALSNLLVPLDTADLARLTPVLVEVVRRYPSRLFLIEWSEAPADDPLRARVTALCHLRPGGGGVVCSEQIVLQASPGGGALLSSAVRSLLVGDLPVVLLDVDAGAERPWLEDLARDADLVLGDSSLRTCVSEIEPFWRALSGAGTGRVHDLAWARLLPWRELLAELFDAPEISGALHSIEEVAIEHGSRCEEEPSPPAVLFAGWLAARLRWKPERRDRGALRLSSTHGPVRISFHSAPGSGTRTLSRVRIRSGAPRPFTVEVEPFGRERRAGVTLAPGGGGTERRIVSFHYRDFATCIVSEIHRHGPNPVLEEAVASARALHDAWRRAA
jgi:glucose-6-phosphate dehydrogenase assembly protein OpcA